MAEFHIRPTRREDAAAVTELINACSTVLFGSAEETEESTLVSWETEGFSLETDSVVMELPDGRLVGTAEFWDIHAVHVSPMGFWRIHPDFQGQGLEDRAAEWVELRAQANLGLAQAGARVALSFQVVDLDRASMQVMEERGYHVVRTSYRMEVDLEGDTPAADFAELSGLRIVPMDESNRDGAILALYEAFRDHWGALPETFEQYRTRTLHLLKYPEVKEELSLAVMDGDEVAAAEICSCDMPNDPQLGWVNLLGVRRRWRNRGIGEALLRRAFASFRARGLTRAGLGVDAQSLTGATRLYERVGMHVKYRYQRYEKELREGIDLRVNEVAA